jgi:hypothetical protein
MIGTRSTGHNLHLIDNLPLAQLSPRVASAAGLARRRSAMVTREINYPESVEVFRRGAITRGGSAAVRPECCCYSYVNASPS